MSMTPFAIVPSPLKWTLPSNDPVPRLPAGESISKAYWPVRVAFEAASEITVVVLAIMLLLPSTVMLIVITVPTGAEAGAV